MPPMGNKGLRQLIELISNYAFQNRDFHFFPFKESTEKSGNPGKENVSGE